MPDPLIPLPAPPPEDEPAESFSAMEEDVVENVADEEVGTAILPCQQPLVELWLMDGAGDPVGGAEYTLSLPGGKRRSGTLDPDGYVRLEDFEVLSAEIEKVGGVIVEEDEQGKLAITITEEAPEEDAEDTGGEEEEEEEELEQDLPERPPVYLKPPLAGA